jgi:hypothetical protein
MWVALVGVVRVGSGGHQGGEGPGHRRDDGEGAPRLAGSRPMRRGGPRLCPLWYIYGADCLWAEGADGRGGRLLRLLHRRGSGLGRVDRLAAGSRRLHAVVVQAWNSSPGTTGFTRCNRPPPWPSGWWRCCRPPTSSQGMVRPSGEPSTLAAAREADRGAGVSRRPAVGGQRHRGTPVPGRA